MIMGQNSIIQILIFEIFFRSGGGGLKAQKQKGELDEQLRDYINEWRKQREKEEEELKRLKEKQAKRKEIRAEQEKKLNQQKKVWKNHQITNYDKQTISLDNVPLE